MFAAMDDRVRSFMKGLYTSEAFGYEDPTYLGFSLHFEFDPTYRDVETGQTEDPLFAEPGTGLESAREYLTNIGFSQKADMLYQFREMLRFMNQKAPYYFQGIQGVAELWKINKESAQSGGQNVFDTFRARNKSITIDCLESVDLRMTALADLYRKATFDAKYMRYILPDNLRWFTIRLRIAEIRKFHRVRGIVAGNNGGAPATTTINTADQLADPNQTSVIPNPPSGAGASQSDILEELDKLISVVEFELSHCEFDFEESFADEFRMSGDTEMAKQKLKIKVGRIEENNHYTLLNLVLRDYYSVDGSGTIVEKSRVNGGFNTAETNTPNRQDFDRSINPSNLFSGVTNTFANPLNAATGTAAQLGNQVTNFLPNQIGSLLNQANAAATSQILGNVYDNLNTFLSSNDILNPQLGGTQESSQGPLGDVYPGVPGDDLSTKSAGNLGNVYQ